MHSLSEEDQLYLSHRHYSTVKILSLRFTHPYHHGVNGYQKGRKKHAKANLKFAYEPKSLFCHNNLYNVWRRTRKSVNLKNTIQTVKHGFISIMLCWYTAVIPSTPPIVMCFKVGSHWIYIMDPTLRTMPLENVMGKHKPK